MTLTARALRERCAREMDNARGFAGCTWLHRAFLAVPREHFVPDRVWWPARGEDGLYNLYDRTQKPRAWLKAVYMPGVPLITQIDDGAVPPTGPATGAFTSSISSPGVVIELVRHLAPEPGERILEVGTGTGYTTALLTHRAGDHGNVVTIEIDAGLARRARHRLHALGMSPRVVTGDGEQGHPACAPYDRILATASVRSIPPAWLRQLRPGGILLAPLDSPFGHDLLVRLEADGHGCARGHFVAAVEFMRARGQRAQRPYAELGWPAEADPGPWERMCVVAGPSGQRIRSR
ncbi:methyltransferase domain-containing protein [Streptomyces sp. MST-110588]|uniref:methyltransferase domain-containing protein n=1 Tax=Streptomyces sp. MST-110588 TaxID=2833628 RepID=UPI001F5E010F|nr:methyltransferase domain-containing protein [Streptomyces sp. MST-110588]UNO38425.1 methyltransferase domain-containing protein [Streptomyces sp. MST-110588]